MKKPIGNKKERIKCVSCNQPIHVGDLGAINKKGFYHKNLVCIMDLVKQKLND